jgi:hypothetical protein
MPPVSALTSKDGMGVGLLAIKSGFILCIKIYQFLHNKNA